jgi:hypothetical protein
LAVLIGGFAGAAMLVAADLTTLIEIRVLTVVQDELSGGDQHAYAMVVLGVAALPLAWGAARRGARPAMLGLALVGLAAALIALIGDLPDLDETGVIGERYEEAAASPGPGFYLETAGAALLLLVGGGALFLTGSGGRGRAGAHEVGDESREPLRPVERHEGP